MDNENTIIVGAVIETGTTLLTDRQLLPDGITIEDTPELAILSSDQQ